MNAAKIQFMDAWHQFLASISTLAIGITLQLERWSCQEYACQSQTNDRNSLAKWIRIQHYCSSYLNQVSAENNPLTAFAGKNAGLSI